MNLRHNWMVVLWLLLLIGWCPLARCGPLDEWVQLSPLPTADTLTGVAYVNGQYLAMGGTGTFLSSKDAVTWTVHKLTASNAVNYQANILAYASGQYVAVGNRGTVLTSTDGLNWMPQ